MSKGSTLAVETRQPVATSAPRVTQDADAPVLAVRNLHKTYHLGHVNVPVLHGVSLSVRRGEFVAVLGASGSGKSTLLHLLGGLDRPDKDPPGEIAFDGRPLTTFSARELDRYRNLDVGFVFQFYHLLPELTVVENVLLGAMIRYGFWRYLYRSGDVKAAAEELITKVGLGHRLRHRPAELSGGERQRVAIARALVNEPRLLLADEPTGNLDHVTGGKILDMLMEIRRERRQTMVVVTHDEETAKRADRIIHLMDGRVVES
jgi:lipoprotein-releasing system ATP-binding protein